MINNSIQTTSLSYSRGDYHPQNANDAEFKAMDDFAFRFPYPVYVCPTANGGVAFESNWQAYNIISVGNVRHTNSNHFEILRFNDPGWPYGPIGGCTQTRNPQQLYGGPDLRSPDPVWYSYYSGDREMPYVVAPGIGPTPVPGLTDPSLGTMSDQPCSGTMSCGTSFSAPTVNGIAADVIGADSRFVNWPERVRAAILVSAQNVSDGEWNMNFDGDDGAGVVSGADAVNFAKTVTSVSPGGTAVQKGMGTGALYQTDFNGANISFNVKIPNPKPSGKHLRVVLTWDATPDLNSQAPNYLSDLDLLITASNGNIHNSGSANGNIEIADIPGADLTAGGTIVANVNKYLGRIPSAAREPFTWYVIVWDWVADHAP